MACTAERSEAIGDFAGGRMDEHQSSELLDHLAVCASCSEEFDTVADLVAAMTPVAVSGNAPSPSMSPSLPPPSPPSRSPASRGPIGSLPVGLLALAATVVVALGAWKLLLAPDGSPSATDRLVALARIEAPPSPGTGSVLRSAALKPGLNARYEKAMTAYAGADFAEAARLLAQISAAAPDHVPTHLYLGISRLQIDDTWSAIAPLTAAATNGTGLARARALWYLANAHLALGDAIRAGDILETLVGTDYELNARELIEAIDAVLGE